MDFNQIDDLSLPGAGLKHLGFWLGMPYTPSDTTPNVEGGQDESQVQSGSPPETYPEKPLVRTYGSEREM